MRNQPLTPLRLTSAPLSPLSPLALLTLLWVGVGCDAEAPVECGDDAACERGLVCESGACVALPCTSISDCPGTGRTCLASFSTCSVKECGDILNGVDLICSAGAVCLNEGPNKFTCAYPTERCVTQDDCVGDPAGPLCCNGECATACGAPPVGGVTGGVTGGDAGGVAGGVMGGDAGGGGGAMTMGEAAHLCSPCRTAGNCAGVGAGAACTPIGDSSFCTRACDASSPCPGGYTCMESLGQCIPTGFRCVDCLQEPCADGTFCDISSGSCVAPQGLCGTCTEDAACADGRLCRPVGTLSLCVGTCEGGCPTGTTCDAGACVPDGAQCDPCGGTCGGATPFCVAAQARCAQCGPGVQCGAGYNCDINTNSCVEAQMGSCISDADCGGGVCVGGECKECLQTADCPPRSACNTTTFTCESDPCGGVECQRGSTCATATGRCTPGCASNMDCADPDRMDCNGETGQCFFKDGTCDFGGEGVCAPGGQCNPNPLAAFDPSLPGSCGCQGPAQVGQPDRVPCQPGTSCVDLSMFVPGLAASCGAF
jgi:hypothetical protein